MRLSILTSLCLTVLALCTGAKAQLAPAGFTGAINSPTADVLSPGTVSGGWTNSNPESPRVFPGIGVFGSFNLGFGVLPGLEMVGRMRLDGTPQCNQYVQTPPCHSLARDMSVSVKYQLPLILPFDTRLAVGAVDIGGAATNFRSYYAVGTATVGATDLTLGYGKGNLAQSSIKGVFGSGQFFLTDNWRAVAEYDSRELRAGMRYARPLSEHLTLELDASRKLTQRSEQQTWQAGIGLSYSLGQKALTEGTRRLAVTPSPATTAPAPATPPITSPVVAALTLPVAVPPVALPSAAVEAVAAPADRAGQLASRLQQAGFSSVWIGFDDAQGWVLQAEPVGWRKNRLDALGMAMALWQKSASAGDHLRLTLTYLQDPVLTARTTATCLSRFAEGGWWCDGQPAMTIDNGESARAPASGWAVAPDASALRLRPQIELGPVLQQRVGSEVGFYDASLGLSVGWELPLARGLLWQGEVTEPLVNSGNFDNNQAFSADRVKSRVESSTVSWQRQIAPRLWAQGSAGYVQHSDFGGQVDAAWLSATGSLRLSGSAGYYQGTQPSGSTLDSLRHPTALAAARWSVIDGRWFMEAQGGQFYNLDRGIKLASQHWYGDNRLTLLYRNTAPNTPFNLPRTQFAGFELTMPIGPRQSTAVGPVTVRGSDQWAYGLQSKVRGGNNMITTGYGVVPNIKHGLMNDTLDYDRAGLGDMMANIYRVRAMLREVAPQP